MRKTWSLIASVALMAACNGNPPAAPPVPAGPFTLVGTVTVNNDCDGQINSIPNNITVKADLQNASGNVAVPGSANIALAPVPGGNPIKSGTYTITVQWPGGPAGAAVNWGNFTETLVGGGDICGSIPCTANTCKNLATRVRTRPVAAPNTTNEVRISCTCVQ